MSYRHPRPVVGQFKPIDRRKTGSDRYPLGGDRSGAGPAFVAYRFRWMTLAGGKPLKEVLEAWL